MLTPILGYSYRDSGLSDALHTININFPKIKNHYTDNLNDVFFDEMLAKLFPGDFSDEEKQDLKKMSEVIQDFLDAGKLISRTINIPLEVGIGGEISKESIISVADTAATQIMSAVRQYVKDVEEPTIISSEIRRLPVTDQPVKCAELYKSISDYWKFAHTEYEAIYDIKRSNLNINTIFVSYYDSCENCEKFLATRIGKINMISYNNWGESRLKTRGKKQQNPNLILDFQ